MSELTLMILRIGFLLLLWLFIFSIVYALRSDLFGAPVRKMKGGSSAGGSAPAPQPATPNPNQPTAFPVVTPSGGALPSASPNPNAPARQLVITEGVATGTAIPLDDDVVTIGRSGDSTLVIVDEYTSTYHARLNRSGSQWTLTDLDSTNGTKLSGQRVTSTVPLPNHTPVTIGKTTFELRP